MMAIIKHRTATRRQTKKKKKKEMTSLAYFLKRIQYMRMKEWFF